MFGKRCRMPHSSVLPRKMNSKVHAWPYGGRLTWRRADHDAVHPAHGAGICQWRCHPLYDAMPSRRHLIAMSADEVRAYLRVQKRLIIISNGLHGYPHPVPMNFAVDEQDRLLVMTFRKSQKVRNLHRDSRAALLVESGDDYSELKAVMIYATAEIIDHGTEFERAWASFTDRPQSDGSMSETQVRAALAKRVIIRFTPERIVSWDHAKLEGRY
jgi:general stress protein 26